MSRNLPDWIEGFAQYTKHLATEDVFRTWGAIFAISAALERKVVFLLPPDNKLFTNMQVIFVAAPGIGKSNIIKVVQRLVAGLPDHKLAHDDISKASLIDELNDARRSIMCKNIEVDRQFNSLSIVSSELGALLPGYDASFLNLLTTLYDCIGFSERRRHRKNGEEIISIPKPQINLLAATTPSGLGEILPEGAWQQGFTARTFMIYARFKSQYPLFNPDIDMSAFRVYEKKLMEDYRRIAGLAGVMTITKEAIEELCKWHDAGGPPIPSHPRLENYKTRRTSMHAIKLAMIASISRHDGLEINKSDVKRGRNWLLDAEKYMPYMFNRMTVGSDQFVIQDLLFALGKAAKSEGGLLSREYVMKEISHRMGDVNKIFPTLETMKNTGRLKIVKNPDDPNSIYYSVTNSGKED